MCYCVFNKKNYNAKRLFYLKYRFVSRARGQLGNHLNSLNLIPSAELSPKDFYSVRRTGAPYVTVSRNTISLHLDLELADNPH